MSILFDDLFDNESPYTYTDAIGICDDIKAFVERELLQTTDEIEINAYKKVINYIKRTRKKIDSRKEKIKITDSSWVEETGNGTEDSRD